MTPLFLQPEQHQQLPHHSDFEEAIEGHREHNRSNLPCGLDETGGLWRALRGSTEKETEAKAARYAAECVHAAAAAAAAMAAEVAAASMSLNLADPYNQVVQTDWHSGAEVYVPSGKRSGGSDTSTSYDEYDGDEDIDDDDDDDDNDDDDDDDDDDFHRHDLTCSPVPPSPHVADLHSPSTHRAARHEFKSESHDRDANSGADVEIDSCGDDTEEDGGSGCRREDLYAINEKRSCANAHQVVINVTPGAGPLVSRRRGNAHNKKHHHHHDHHHQQQWRRREMNGIDVSKNNKSKKKVAGGKRGRKRKSEKALSSPSTLRGKKGAGKRRRSDSECSTSKFILPTGNRYNFKDTDSSCKVIARRAPITKELVKVAERAIKSKVKSGKLQEMLKPMVPERKTKDIRVNKITGKRKARPLTADDFSEQDRIREKEIRARAAKAATDDYEFKCLVCDKQFRSRVGFTYHMRQNVCYMRAQRHERNLNASQELKVGAARANVGKRKRKGKRAASRKV